MNNHIIVTESAKNVRTIARTVLKGNWTMAVLVTLIFSAMTLAPMLVITDFLGWTKPAVQTVLSIYSMVVAGPLTYGYIMFISNMFRKTDPAIGDVFEGFERFGKTLGLYLYIALFTFLWALLFVVPGIVAAYRYSQAFYILRDNPQISIPQAVELSKRMMMGNKAKLFFLDFSFFGWMLLAAVPASVAAAIFGEITSVTVSTLLSAGMLWLTPYMETANFAFYEVLSGHMQIRHEASGIYTDDASSSGVRRDGFENPYAESEKTQEKSRPAADPAPYAEPKSEEKANADEQR